MSPSQILCNALVVASLALMVLYFGGPSTEPALPTIAASTVLAVVAVAFIRAVVRELGAVTPSLDSRRRQRSLAIRASLAVVFGLSLGYSCLFAWAAQVPPTNSVVALITLLAYGSLIWLGLVHLACWRLRDAPCVSYPPAQPRTNGNAWWRRENS